MATKEVNLGSVRGPQGAAATVSVGKVTTGAAGSSAAVTNSGTSGAARPQGKSIWSFMKSASPDSGGPSVPGWIVPPPSDALPPSVPKAIKHQMSNHKAVLMHS